MSHTRILDRIGRPFVNLPSVQATSKGSLQSRLRVASRSENSQESDFDCKAFMDISTELIAQFLKPTDALQNFGSAEATRECCSFLFCNRYLALCHIVVRPKNVSPPRKQCLYQRGTPFQIQALSDCLVVFFAFCQPRAVGCILVADLFPFQCLVSF